MSYRIVLVVLLAVSPAHAGPPACGDSAAGNCCEANGTPACDDLDCCEALCDTSDAFCCDVVWDQICADAAIENSGVCDYGNNDNWIIVGRLASDG